MRRQLPAVAAWTLGGLVVVAAAVAVAVALTREDGGVGSNFRALRSEPKDLEPLLTPELIQDMPLTPAEATIRGVVRQPDGAPAPGSTVTLYKMVTGWPEWSKDPVETAITNEAGAFQFGVPRRYGYLVEFENDVFAGGLKQVPAIEQDMQLQLRPGFSIVGTVLNDVGAPVPKARVSMEAAPPDSRRARTVETAADGSYAFTNVAAGPVRMVARHDSWQPVSASKILIGDRGDAEFRFERPTMAPLRGAVVSAETGAPVVGATVQTLPIKHTLGLVAPITAATAADGSFLLEGLPRAQMRMWVRHPDYGVVSRTQSIGAAAAEISIELPNRTSVTGTLVSRMDAAFQGGEVLQLRDSAGELAFAEVGEDGEFVFDRDVSPGLVDISSIGGALSFRTFSGRSAIVLLGERPENRITIEVMPPPAVRGRVVDGEGRPVAGAKIEQTQELGDNVQSIREAAMTLDIRRAGTSLAQLSDPDELLAISDSDGVFELRGMNIGELLVRLSCEGYGSQLMRLQMPPFGEAADLGDVPLRASGRISGRVLRGGRALVGATVTASPLEASNGGEPSAANRRRPHGARPSSLLAIAGRGGRFELRGLEPGRYEVRARSRGRNARSDTTVVTVMAGAPSRPLEIAIRAGRGLDGVVRNVAGQPLADALISVRGRPGEVTRSRTDGTFSVELTQRRAELIVSLGDRSMESVVAVERDQESVEVQLDALPTCAIAATVFGVPNRRRLQGVLMRTTAVGELAAAAPLSRWMPTPDGALSRSGVPSGRVRLEFRCDGYAPLFIDENLQANEVNQLGELVFERGSRLRGLVLDEAQRPVPDAVVLLGEESDFDLFASSVRTASDGSFVIDGVTSRSRQVVVRHPAFAARTLKVELPRDVLAAEPLPIVLERGGTIEVVVPLSEMPDNGLVFLRRDGRLVTSTVLDERGYAWFSNRSAGAYSVKLASRELDEREVVVKPGVEVTRLLF